jgi:hypothetical protein
VGDLEVDGRSKNGFAQQIEDLRRLAICYEDLEGDAIPA